MSIIFLITAALVLHLVDVMADKKLLIHGAMGRHNFGDILMPHMLTKLFSMETDIDIDSIIYTDVLANDMRIFGGFNTFAVSDYFKSNPKWANTTFDVIIGGGEILGCPVPFAVSLFENERTKYFTKNNPEKRDPLFDRRPLAYVLEKKDFAHPGLFMLNTIGGGGRHSNYYNELIDYDFRSYRNPNKEGKAVEPDSVVTVKRLFGDRVEVYADASFAYKKYIAFQHHAHDSAPPHHVAAMLTGISTALDLPIVFFRAGAATGHDTLPFYHKVGALLDVEFYVMPDLDVWKIVALISRATLMVSSSLHTRIIAFAYQVPRVTLDCSHKQIAFIEYYDKSVFNISRASSHDETMKHVAITALSPENLKIFQQPKIAADAAEKYIKDVFRPMAKLMGHYTGKE